MTRDPRQFLACQPARTSRSQLHHDDTEDDCVKTAIDHSISSKQIHKTIRLIMAPRDSGDDKTEAPTERERGFATLDKLRYA